MRRIAALTAVVITGLTGCTDPRQACEDAAQAELRDVSRLIVETEQTLARGYRLETVKEPQIGFTFCMADSIGSNVGVSYCNTSAPKTSDRPVAIDVAAEKRKLADLSARLPALRARTDSAMAQCAARYPV